MTLNFHQANLPGRSFKGENLTGADFSNADIRGVNFTNARLIGANFNHAKAGLTPCSLAGLIWIFVILAVLSGLMIGYAGVLPGLIVSLLSQENTLARQILLLIGLLAFTIFIYIIIRQGLGISLGIWAIVIAILTAIIASQYREEIGADALIGAFIISIIVAGILLGSLIKAVFLSITQKNKALILFVIPAILGAIRGAIEGVQGISSKFVPVSLVMAGIFGICLLLLSAYIGIRAMAGDQKYSLVKAIAIDIFIILGTNFKGAILTDADFTNAKLQYADFRNANLTRTCWLNARQLDLARVNQTYLENPAISKLVVNKDAEKVSFDNIKCNLNLENASLKKVSFIGADIGEANLKGVTCIDVNFDEANLHNVNLAFSKLQDTSFIGADLSKANLQNADLSGAKLVRTQLYEADLTGANLTGAFIQDWGISEKTKLHQIKCEEIFMQLPTKENKYDPCRKPDEADEYFQEGDFIDFITPLRDTLKEYHQKYFDPRQQVRILDLPHRGGIDSLAAAITLKELTDRYPQAGIEVVALQGGRDKNIRLQIKVNKEVNRSQIITKYKEKYREIVSLSNQEKQSLVANVNKETNECIRSLGNIIDTVMSSKQIYLEPEINFLGKKKILFLAADPQHQDQHRLQVEIRDIQNGLEKAKRREQFDIIPKWAVSLDDLRHYLLQENPQIVHFSGYGVPDEGLAFENEDGQTQFVKPLNLAKLFELFKDKVEFVLLNACYTELQAEAISEHIDYVIGINQEISDRAAIKFVVGFYDALGAGRSIEDAFKLGCIAIDLDNLPDSLKPLLKQKKREII